MMRPRPNPNLSQKQWLSMNKSQLTSLLSEKESVPGKATTFSRTPRIMTTIRLLNKMTAASS
jgi:hypothetical protein